MSGQDLFSRRTSLAIAIFAAMSLAYGMYFAIFGETTSTIGRANHDSFSVSAVGHQAMLQMLRELKVPVIVSRYQTTRKLEDHAALVVAEPTTYETLEHVQKARLVDYFHAAEALLLILPKWDIEADADRPEWVGRAKHVPPNRVTDLLEYLQIRARVVRTDLPPESVQWVVNHVGPNPEIRRMQLLESRDVTPLIACSEGVLLAEATRRDGGRILLLSDPDLVANFNLRTGRNAALACAIVDNLAAPDRAVVWDEVSHGHLDEPAVWRELFAFPGALIPIHGLLALFLLLWASVARFGDPARDTPPLPPGYSGLMDNTADLFVFTGHSLYGLTRYYQSAVADVAAALKLPLSHPDLHSHLARAAAARKVTLDIGDLHARLVQLVPDSAAKGETTSRDTASETRAALALAGEIYQWKMEMLHGSADPVRHRRSPTFANPQGGDRAA